MRYALAALALGSALFLWPAGKLPARPIDLNTATATELTQLPKIGAKTAERIVAFRKQHGGFRRLEELMNVKGVGEKTFAGLKPYLTLGKAASPHS